MSRKHSRDGASRAPSQRQLRVGELIRTALSEIFLRGDIQDPVLSKTIVTVSEVRCSPDLRQATIFVAPLGGGNSAEMLQALGRVRRYLKGEVARRMTLKYMPDLHFKEDTSFDYAASVDTILHKESVARDLSSADEEDEDEA